MKKVFIFFIFLSCSQKSFSQFDNTSLSARGRGMGGVSLLLSDFWSGISNLSTLAYHENITLGISSQNQFLLKELSVNTFGISVPVNKLKGAFGLHYLYNGTSFYNEQKLGLAYSQKLGDLSLGLQLDYLVSNSSYSYQEKEQFLTFEIGGQYKINNNIEAGFLLFNPIPRKREDKQDIPSILKLGILYRIISPLITIIEFEKNLVGKQILRFGIEYEFLKIMYARIGVSGYPAMYSLGYGVKYYGFDLDFGTQIHSILGVSPSLSVCYHF